MKILCSYSGLDFTCEHFPGTFHSNETFHPIFHLEQKKLLSYMGKWSAGGLTPTDSYLLFLALLKSTDLVHFRTAVFRAPFTDALVANTMESLARVIIKMNAIHNVEELFPHYYVNADTRTLENIPAVINTWFDEYNDWKSNYKFSQDTQKLIRRETALEKLIKNPHKEVSSYASSLADWACVAGQFPDYLTESPFTKMKIPMSEYWKTLIVKCTKADSLFSVPQIDLEDLLEHCQLNIPAGSIYSFALFKVLKSALEKHKNFLGFGDSDLGKTTYTILTESTNVEDAQIKMMVDNAPKEKPQRHQYAKDFDYLRAKARWDMAQRYKKDDGEEAEGVSA